MQGVRISKFPKIDTTLVPYYRLKFNYNSVSGRCFSALGDMYYVSGRDFVGGSKGWVFFRQQVPRLCCLCQIQIASSPTYFLEIGLVKYRHYIYIHISLNKAESYQTTFFEISA